MIANNLMEGKSITQEGEGKKKKKKVHKASTAYYIVNCTTEKILTAIEVSYMKEKSIIYI